MSTLRINLKYIWQRYSWSFFVILLAVAFLFSIWGLVRFLDGSREPIHIFGAGFLVLIFGVWLLFLLKECFISLARGIKKLRYVDIQTGAAEWKLFQSKIPFYEVVEIQVGGELPDIYSREEFLESEAFSHIKSADYFTAMFDGNRIKITLPKSTNAL